MSVVTYKIRAIRCNIGGCDTEMEGLAGQSVTEVRQAAEGQGWTSVGNLDRCPVHGGEETQ